MSAGTALRVGYIGLGDQGGPIARRIVDAGVPITLWARRPASLEPYRDTAARYASSPAELGAEVDLACVCVLDDAATEEIIAGPAGLLAGLRPGAVVAVQGTVRPETCVRLAELAGERGIAFLDAPVSGGGPAAARGELLVMVGGEAEVVGRCLPVFETYGRPVVHLGPVGAGQRAKLINNLLLTANLGVAESAFALAREFGVDPAQLGTVLAHGSGNSFAAALLRPPDFTLAPLGDHAGPLLQKDVRLVAKLAEAAGAKPGAVLDAADVALDSLHHPR